MKIDGKHIGSLLVGIPVFHLLSASLYLWAYCMGFGAKLGGFTTSADLFTTSITNMVTVYASAILVPAVMNFHKYLPGYTPPTFPAKIAERGINGRKLVQYTFFTFGAFFIIEEVYLVWGLGRPVQYFTFLMAANFILAVPLWKIAERLEASRFAADVIYFLPLFFLSALFLGLDAGSNDRHLGYAESRFSYGRCGKSLVLRQIADNYLVIRPSGRKALIDKDCKVRVKFPLLR